MHLKNGNGEGEGEGEGQGQGQGQGEGEGEGSILPLLVLSYQQHQPLVFSLSAFGSKLDEMKPVNFSSVVS